MKVPLGFTIDNPAMAVVEAIISFGVGDVTTIGNAAGTTFTALALATEPSYVGHKVKMLSGDAAGQERVIATMAAGVITVINPWTDNAGAVVQIVVGTHFTILGIDGSSATPGVSPIIGWGTLDTDSMTVPADSTRAALWPLENNDYFKGCTLMPIAGDCYLQPRPIRSYVAATGVFTLDEPFSQLPGTEAYVIIRSDYPVQRLIDIFNIVNGILVNTETGGTLNTDGTEQDVYINNAPAGVFEPQSVQIDFTDQTAAEEVIVRTYYRNTPGGGLILADALSFSGVQAQPLKEIKLKPNRYGVQVTLERVTGAAQDYIWEVFYKV